MRYVLDLLYLLALLLLSPWLVYKALTTKKYRRGLLAKFLGHVPVSARRSPRVWFHGVSVGEIHMLRRIVAAFRKRHPEWECVVSTTTDTGFDEAVKHFPGLAVFFFPFDFSWAVRRALGAVSPDLIVLAEGEVWPNFVTEAKRQSIPVAVVNGRFSPRSARRYHRLRWLARPLLRRVDLFAMQTEDYADSLRTIGVEGKRITVTGNVKYDGVETDRENVRSRQLRHLFNVRPDELVLIAGSTQAPEEEVALGIYQRAKQAHGNLRLILVPRQRERFDEVAALLRRSGVPFARRSELHRVTLSPCHPVILVDTIGELSAVWGLADVAFVGGSLDGKRGGQNMIEPAAYGAAVIFGPHVWNFRDTATRLVAAGGAAQAADAGKLEEIVRDLLADAGRRGRMGAAARQFVLAQQGATERTMDALDALLERGASQSRAA